MADLEEAVEQVGVLRPGDRLILKVDRRLSAEDAARLHDMVEERLPGTPLVILDGGIEAIIDRSGGDG